ncbi:M48 family metallopeptidase [Citreimonas salinaria]|uniref:Peptidase family M48 n=1 Tax=Citreimonas salinaria TaxID=321339 RepID=A0A1H3IU51_9RHOB|nr:M48 family metallopeptidase [Citreimonas salinaria]SDY30809.1 Peptidase family M48 [Citreimonas salinaria]
MCGNCRIGRRAFLCLAGGAAATGLSGCDDITLVSDEEVRQMGLRAWSEIRGATALSGDTDARQAAQQVGARLLAAAGEDPAHWEIAVFAGPEINAFALPGNKIGLYEGMFGVFENADQLAAVVGHEIGHLQAEHSQERLSAAVAKDQGLAFLRWLLRMGEVEFADAIAAAMGVGLEFGVVLPYSRRQELEADRLGVLMMDEAGFDAREAVGLWQAMDSASQGRPPEFLATHPAPAARIAEIEQILTEL